MNNITLNGVRDSLVTIFNEESCVNLERLDLYGNYIQKEGCVFIAEALSKHPLKKLTFLNMGSCHIGDEGLELISQKILASENYYQMTEFCAQDNSIGDNGVYSIITALSKDKSQKMQILNLSHNNFSGRLLMNFHNAMDKGFLRDIHTIYINKTNTFPYQIEQFNQNNIEKQYLPWNYNDLNSEKPLIELNNMIQTLVDHNTPNLQQWNISCIYLYKFLLFIL